jgi:hypothetical protein
MLDILSRNDYPVLMEEQLVQYNEHITAPEDTTTVPIVPAPMVGRAFRLLDL